MEHRFRDGSIRGWALAFVAFGVVAAFTACPDAVQVAPKHTRHNLLLVTIDTLRADHVGAYGAASAETTALDELARRGVLFENAMAAAPLTLPSHSTLLSGQHPPHHGVRHNGLYSLSDDTRTLAEALRDAGFSTAGVVGAIVLARSTGIGQGFDVFDDGGSRKASEVGGFLERSATEVTDRALEILSDLPEPFAIWVHYYDPHIEWKAPAPYSEQFGSDGYSAEIAYTDSQLARLLEALERQGTLERTLVAVTSDHGEGLGEHGEQTHSYTLYDATLNVPLILSGPGLPAGVRVPDVVGGVDLAPTLLDALGVDPLPEADGRSLAPLWSGGSLPARGAYSETLATRFNHGWAPLHSWRTATHRYVQAPRPELYELASDPHETRNLLEESPDASATAPYRDAIAAVLANETEDRRRELDPDSRRKLVALGYALPEGEIAENQLDPKDGLVLLERYAIATQHLGAGEHAEARPIFDAVLEQMPDSALTHSHQARVLAALGDLEGAARHAERSTALVPGSGEFLATQAMIELQMGHLDDAARHFEEANAADPTLSQCQAGAMWAAARRGDIDAAVTHEQRALELDPQGWRSRQWLATLWSQLGNPLRAIELLEDALDLAPGEPDLRRDLAVDLVRVGRSEDAARHLAGLPPPEASAVFGNRMAIAWAQSGDTDRAIALFEKVVEAHPRYAPAQHNLASLKRSLARH